MNVERSEHDDCHAEKIKVAVITFPSSHHALRAEKMLRDERIPVHLIPLPTGNQH